MKCLSAGVFAIILATSTLLLPVVNAQGTATQEDWERVEGNITQQLEAIQSHVLNLSSAQANLTNLVTMIMSMVQNQNSSSAQAHNATWTRLDISQALLQQILPTQNHSIQQVRQDLSALADELVQLRGGFNTTQAAIQSSASSVQASADGITNATTQIGSRLSDLDAKVLAMHETMTLDHVRIYSGTFITDPNDSLYQQPYALKIIREEEKLARNQKVIAENQVTAHNSSKTQFDQLSANMGGINAKFDQTSEGVSTRLQAVEDQLSWRFLKELGKFAAAAVFVGILILYVPDLLIRIQAKRARTVQGLPEEEPTIEEQIDEAQLELARHEAQERMAAPPRRIPIRPPREGVGS